MQLLPIFRLFQSSDKMDLLYTLLVKDIISRNGDRNNEKTSKSCVGTDAKTKSYESIIIEISNSFDKSNSFFISYWMQTITKLFIAAGLLNWLVYKFLYTMMASKNIGSEMCYVYDYWYECSGHPRKLTICVTILASFLIMLHILLNIINLIWLNCPNIGEMSRVMEK